MVDKVNNIHGVDNLADLRVYKSLDDISSRLTSIESKLTEVVRLEEKVSNHEQALGRFGRRLDSHDNRVRDLELWQAHRSEQGHIDEEVKLLKAIVNDLQDTSSINKGQKDVVKEILKWIVGTLTALLIWILTKD